MTKQYRFKTVLFKGGDAVNSGTFAQMEFDSISEFGTKGRVPVKGAINGYAFRGTLMPYGSKHLLTVNKPLQAGANARAGDEVEIVVEKDNAPRIVEAPDDLAVALSKDETAKAMWDKLVYSHKKEFVDVINDAKKPETRARRIEKAIAELRAKAHPR